MTTIRISHRTVYRYARPVTLGRHRLVLRPREGHDMRVAMMRLSIEPKHRFVWTRDVFDNSVAVVDFLEPTQELSIESEVIAERSIPFPDLDPYEPWLVAYPFSYDPLETIVASSYLTVNYPDDVDEVKSWLDAELAPPQATTNAEEYLFQLGGLINRTIRYQRRAERGVQSPAQTLALRSGSCRDMATLMMDAARQLGYAARFASGYLDCPASEAGRASMHAWIEAYLPLLGWRGYDPTIGEPTSLKHVPVGVSNHPRGVMPVSGMFSGQSSDYLQMIASVKIEKVETTTPRVGQL